MSVEILDGWVQSTAPLKVRIFGSTTATEAECVTERVPPVGSLVKVAVVGSSLLVLNPSTDAQTLDGKEASDFLLTTGKAADSSKLNGNTANYFRYRGQRSLVNDVDHNENYLNAVSLNAYFGGGSYQTYNCPNAPVAGGWGWLEVHTHVGGAHWQRQRYVDMNGSSYLGVWERYCAGGDPLLAGSWSPWFPLQGPDTIADMYRTTNYDGPDNARYEVPMTAGKADNTRCALYWNGVGRLVTRFTGIYEFTAIMHTTTLISGVHSVEINATTAGASGEGAEDYIGYSWHQGRTGSTVNLASGPVQLNANTGIRLVISAPDGTAYVHNMYPRLRGRFLGPIA